MSDTGPDPAVMLQALGAFLLATHPHEARPDAETPWLLRRGPSCPACDELRDVLGLKPVGGEPTLTRAERLA